MDDQFKKHLLTLIDEALETATTAGMEYAADMEGCSATGKTVKECDAEADAAKQRLLDALGIEE